MDLRERYADKIAKLLAKAESTTPEEAELLQSKAQELMTRWQIDEAMVQAARGFDQTSHEIVMEEFVVVGIYRFPLAQLCRYVTSVNDCKRVILEGKNQRTIDGKLFRETIVFETVGYKSDLDRARMMFASLQLQAVRAENAWWKENEPFHAHEKRGGHYSRRQFLFSFADAVGLRLHAAKQKAQQAAEQEYDNADTSVALVLRDKSSMVLEKYEELYPGVETHKASTYKGGAYQAHQAGKEAGEKADLGGNKVGGSRKSLPS